MASSNLDESFPSLHDYYGEIDELDCDFSLEEKLDDLKNKFHVITREDARTIMDKFIVSVQTMVQLPPTTVRTALMHYRWDKDKFLDDYFQDEDKFYKNIGVINGGSAFTDFNEQKVALSEVAGKETTGEVFCEICFDTQKTNEMITFKCGHIYCSLCCTEYLNGKIMAGGGCHVIVCPTLKCNIVIDNETVIRLVTDPNLRSQYENAAVNNFIANNNFLRWCPGPDCDKVIEVYCTSEAQEIQCTCEHNFCFECGEPWHGPVACKLLALWTKRLETDAGSSNWLTKNTRGCPRCRANIVKSSGCNHVTCRSSGCGFQFCWICQEPWKNHHACSRYVPFKATPTQNDTDKIRRFTFYENLYKSNIDALRFEDTLNANLEDVVENFYCCQVSVQFLKEVIEALRLCRQTLMYSYVFRFYVKDSNQVTIFENNQNDLQEAVASLSKYLDGETYDQKNLQKFLSLPQKLKNYCEERRDVLVSHVKEGNEQDFWEWDLDA